MLRMMAEDGAFRAVCPPLNSDHERCQKPTLSFRVAVAQERGADRRARSSVTQEQLYNMAHFQKGC